jgi:UDP-3-O-[3-hydroxymyristoyl] glucosamine N-acyltransferase
VSLSLAEITAALGGELHGDPALEVERLAPLESARESELSFLSNPRYRQQLAGSHAGCVIVAPAQKDEALARGSCIVTPDPYVYFARLTQLWKQRHTPNHELRVHPSAVIHPTAEVHPTVVIGALTVVERGVRIGAGTVLKSRVTVAENCEIGEHCIVHPGAVIGADGFGFAPHEGEWVKIEQLGAVRIGNHVEVGANTCIDRGALGDTVIEDGVKLDNLIQIAHNVRIGEYTAIAACTGIAGSATIGKHCTIGGAAMIHGHITIVDRTFVSAGTFVGRSILQPGHYTGIFPMDDNANWEKNAAVLRQLYRMRERLKALEKRA